MVTEENEMYQLLKPGMPGGYSFMQCDLQDTETWVVEMDSPDNDRSGPRPRQAPTSPCIPPAL